MECIICKKIVHKDDKSVIHNPRRQGLLTLISSAEKRQDECGKNIIFQRDSILSGNIKIKYHIQCRKSYTSEQNMPSSQVDNGGTSQTAPKSVSITRRSNSNFNIRNMCLICDKSGTKKKQKLIAVQTGKSLYVFLSFTTSYKPI